jgi:hypothetical protein
MGDALPLSYMVDIWVQGINIPTRPPDSCTDWGGLWNSHLLTCHLRSFCVRSGDVCRAHNLSERKDDQAGDRTQDLPVSWGMLYR